jgi:phosphate starvation-inducible PhoH-like protein
MPRRNKNSQPQRSKNQPRRNARPGNKGGYNDQYSEVPAQDYGDESPVALKAQPLRALKEAQFNAIAAIHANDITFLVGPAGTGKSYITAAIACEMLLNKEIDKIVITRPKMCVDDEDFGALPGEIENKFAPYMEGFTETMEERLGKSYFEYLVKRGRIVAKPLAFLRGCTFKDKMFVILDEGQNVTKEQMKCYLTRVGQGGVKMVITGDCEQSDVRRGSGLADAIERLQEIPGIGVEEFEEGDIVRSALCKAIVIAYRR